MAVFPATLPSTAVTGRLYLREIPRLPWNRFRSHRPYCTHRDRSSPRFRRMASFCAALSRSTPSPYQDRSGSPGHARARKNTTSDRTSSRNKPRTRPPAAAPTRLRRMPGFF